ncbi:hypothetical protein SESBI_34733 [Sesbania bispinosa]|nr:hypothetical protein SESBI_34733 [Sesbania bispinosa]
MSSSPTSIAKTVIDFLCDLSIAPSATEKLSMLEDFTANLQQELAKIDPSQPPLPFDPLKILNDAISGLKAVLNKECDKNQDYELDNKNNEKEIQCVDEKEKEDSVITSRALSSSPWTPELHLKFLEALEVLGGSEV